MISDGFAIGMSFAERKAIRAFATTECSFFFLKGELLRT